MTDQNSQTPAQQPPADPQAPVVTPQAVYLKDASFESPNGPFGSFDGQPAVILKPSGVIGVLVQILRADTMMLSVNHSPQAS